jgi:hypothetical protein
MFIQPVYSNTRIPAGCMDEQAASNIYAYVGDVIRPVSRREKNQIAFF